MLKLLAQSITELFIKTFTFIVNKRAHEIKNRPISRALKNSDGSQIARNTKNLTQSHPGLSGFSLLENNLDAFIVRSHLISQAEKTLDLQYYYFNGDTSGHLIAELLIKAANRGVRVRLLLDDIDTLGADEPIRILNAHPEIEIRIFNPFKFRSLLRYIEFITDLSRVSRRMHNKAMIMDNCQAIIGGRNIGDIYFAADPELLFLDVDLLSLGPVVGQISSSFDEYWNSQWAIPVEVLYGRLEKRYALKRIKLYFKKYVQDVQTTDYIKTLQLSSFSKQDKILKLPYLWSKADLFYDAPSKIDGNNHEDTKRLKNNIREIIDSAKSELVFISPYFVPGKQGVKLFGELVKKGIKVSVFTNSLAATDVIAVHAGYAAYRKELLMAGVEIYELKPSAYARQRKKFKILRAGSRTSLHAKTIIVDRHRVFIGSPNLDPRSKDLNTEMGLLVNNRELADQVMKIFADIAAKYNSYYLKYENNRLVWVSEEAGQKKKHYTEPQVGFWRKLAVIIFRLLPVEELL